jgi:hypothetical protein
MSLADSSERRCEIELASFPIEHLLANPKQNPKQIGNQTRTDERQKPYPGLHEPQKKRMLFLALYMFQPIRWWDRKYATANPRIYKICRVVDKNLVYKNDKFHCYSIYSTELG